MNRFFARCLDVIARSVTRARAGASHRPSPRLKPHLGVERLEDILAPASLTWANLTGDGNAMNPNDYYITGTEMVATSPLQQGDGLTFDGNVSSASANGLKGFGNAMAPAGTSPSYLSEYADFASINLINGYNGTVSLAPSVNPGTQKTVNQVSVLALTVNSGTIAQQSLGQQTQTQATAQPQASPQAQGQSTLSTDLTVYGAIDWTGGTIGNTALGTAAAANLWLEGGGTIAPANAGTVTLGDTLNVDALYGATTLTQLPGTMQMVNANSAGMDVKPGAMVQEAYTSNNANTSIIPAVNFGTQQITIETGGAIKVTGTGIDNTNTWTTGLPISNSGSFALSGLVTANLKGGNANNPLVYDYTQTVSASALVIQNGSTLSTSVGLCVNGGTVLLKTNTATGASQGATILGNLTFEGGTIQFDPPIQIGTAKVYGSLLITGNVYWGGGTYNPWVNYTPVAGGVSSNSNYWGIGGTLTIPNLNGDVIQPAVQNMPANGLPPAKTSWDILQAKKLSNNNNAYLPTVDKDVNQNQLTLNSLVVGGATVWSLGS